MKWVYDQRGNYWSASRPYHDGICDFIYSIMPVKGGYIAEACNNAFGCHRVAVTNQNRTKGSVFKNLEKLMKDIENGKTYWLYDSHCNCIGKITREEY